MKIIYTKKCMVGFIIHGSLHATLIVCVENEHHENEDIGEIDAQWDSFDERADEARAPVFYVGGNHDLSGSVLQGVWDKRIGRRRLSHVMSSCDGGKSVSYSWSSPPTSPPRPGLFGSHGPE